MKIRDLEIKMSTDDPQDMDTIFEMLPGILSKLGPRTRAVITLNAEEELKENV